MKRVPLETVNYSLCVGGGPRGFVMLVGVGCCNGCGGWVCGVNGFGLCSVGGPEVMPGGPDIGPVAFPGGATGVPEVPGAWLGCPFLIVTGAPIFLI